MSESIDTQIGGTDSPAPSALDKKGLHNRLQRILHYDVNVSNLERAREWIESITPLRVVAETSADQAFPSLGMERGRFEGFMMRDATKGAALRELSQVCMLHVVEWKDPAPAGTPYVSQANVGWYRINVLTEDYEESVRACVAQGSHPFAPPLTEAQATEAAIPFRPGEAPRSGGYRPFCVHDPDGITWEFEPASPDFGGVGQVPLFVAHNTSDVDRYLSFYTEALGLDFLFPSQPQEPVKNIYSPIGGTANWSGAMFALRGGPPSFDWLEWDTSREFATPYEFHNHLGVIRLAMEVDDLDAAYRTLERSSWARDHRIVLGPPEVWDYGAQFGTREVLNFANPEGVFFQLHQQVRSEATLHPWDAPTP